MPERLVRRHLVRLLGSLPAIAHFSRCTCRRLLTRPELTRSGIRLHLPILACSSIPPDL
jgi:hypothetical protein